MSKYSPSAFIVPLISSVLAAYVAYTTLSPFAPESAPLLGLVVWCCLFTVISTIAIAIGKLHDLIEKGRP